MLRKVGFICNCAVEKNLYRDFFLFRVTPMAEFLAKQQAELFIYSWENFNPETEMVLGYGIRDKKFVKMICPLPKVNGYWFCKKVGYSPKELQKLRNFRKYCQSHGVKLFPEHDCTRLLRDKEHCARVLDKVKGIPHPRTEVFKKNQQQLRDYFQQCKKVFIKPNKGRQGDKIFVLEQQVNSYRLSFYKNKKKSKEKFSDLEKVIQQIGNTIKEECYLIQEGVDTPLYKSCPFIFRTILTFDGSDWHYYSKVVTAAGKSDIANTTQGGKNYHTDEVLRELYGEEKRWIIHEKLRVLSYKVNTLLATLYPSSLLEHGYDFMIDKEDNFYLIELNTHPGVHKPGVPLTKAFKDIFNRSKKEEYYYQRYIFPYGSYLAKFLLGELKKSTQEEVQEK